MGGIVGFMPAGRWRRVAWDKERHGEAYPGLEPAAGAEPLWCEILVSLTGRQLTELLQPSVRYADAERMVAPCVRAWNAAAEQIAEDGSRSIEVLPAPSVAGPDVFGLISRDAFDWIFDRVRFSSIEDPDRPNSPKPATGRADGPDETTDPAAAA